MKINQFKLVIPALMLTTVLLAGIHAEALAQCSGHSPSVKDQSLGSGQVVEQIGTFIVDQGNPAPGYPGLSNRMASNQVCGQAGTHVWEMGSLAPPHSCMQRLSKNHCGVNHASCRGHSGTRSCG